MDLQLAKRVFSCIDNTTLAATDNDATVGNFCRRTLDMRLADGTSVAAVCVYPRFVGVASKILSGSGIKVASVAGAFPHGQLPIALKVEEVKYAVGEGADEIDIVISRGLLLAGCDDAVCDEVAMLKESCQGRKLKVILETCELPSPNVIKHATQLAIDGGADFVKTSTGKSTAGATPEAAEAMLRNVKNNVKFNKKIVGFKAAGGIRTIEDALIYAEMAKKMIGDNYIENKTFRIGTSHLTESMFSLLTF